MNRKPERRYVIIALSILLMASSIFVVGESIVESLAEGGESGMVVQPSVPSKLVGEISGFEYSGVAQSFLKSSAEGGRTFASFRARRAYEGGPPTIPHDVDDDRSFGGDNCLTCHGKGGYVPKFNAYTPVTPHPDLKNCRQCHNPERTDGVFRTSTFEPIAWTSLRGGALPGGPPPIPHKIRMRENCIACHAGPGAVQEIRTTHPDRINCRQCHALSTEDEIWRRPGGDKLP
ncbi:MAG: cytochrome C [Candidatus Kapaibacterium sp.]